MTLAPAGIWAGQIADLIAGQIADLISLADLVMLHQPCQRSVANMRLPGWPGGWPSAVQVQQAQRDCTMGGERELETSTCGQRRPVTW